LLQVTQFGYVAFFGVSFPLAALVCMLHTMLRLRSNALRLTQLSRRPRPQAVDGVGLWATLLFSEARLLDEVVRPTAFRSMIGVASLLPSSSPALAARDEVREHVAVRRSSARSSTL